MLKEKVFHIEYNPPNSLEEAFSRRTALGADIEQIQAQLGDRKIDLEWRKKAKIALLCKTEELRRIKQYIRDSKEEIRSSYNELKNDFKFLLLNLKKKNQIYTEEIEFIINKYSYLLSSDNAKEL